MSNFSQLPQNISLPSELAVRDIDPAMPPESKSNSIRVYAINNPTVTSSFSTGTSATATTLPEIPFPQTEINFDIPVSQSKSTFIDTRLSTVSFRCIVTTTTAGNIKISSGTLRSSAYAYFDNMRVTGQSGNLLENFNEYGLVADTLINGQLSNSDREGLFNYGFKSNFGSTGGTAGTPVFTNTGHDIAVLSKGVALTLNDSMSYNYSIPLLSSTVGVLADKFFPCGLTKKLMVTLTTASVLPFTIQTLDTTTPTASTVTVQLTDFQLNLETISIGDSAMNSILSNLHDGKMYLHGQTYKTTTSIIPAGSTGSLNLPIGITGTSVRSLFTRFYEGGAISNTIWGKYNSANPNLNQFGYNIGGIQVPPSLYNPSLHPALCWRSFLMAMGCFNSTQFKSGVTQLNYGRLVAGGTATVVNGNQSSTQDAIFSSAAPSSLYQSSFLLGENLETVPKRGLLSGRDLTFQKVNLVLGLGASNTNSINVFVTALMDSVTIVDVYSGDTQTIL